jgi:hypothetical protein
VDWTAALLPLAAACPRAVKLTIVAAVGARRARRCQFDCPSFFEWQDFGDEIHIVTVPGCALPGMDDAASTPAASWVGGKRLGQKLGNS